ERSSTVKKTLAAVAALLALSACGSADTEPTAPPKDGPAEASKAVLGERWPFLDEIPKVSFYCSKNGGISLGVDEPAERAGAYAFNGTARGERKFSRDTDGITK